MDVTLLNWIMRCLLWLNSMGMGLVTEKLSTLEYIRQIQSYSQLDLNLK